jgi:hypothetical protein
MGSRQGMATLADNAKRGVVDDLVALGRSWQPDVILHGHHELGGWLAAELLGIPNVPFAMTIRWLDPGLLGMFAGTQVAELLARFGLPPDPDLTRPTRWLYLDTSPRALTGGMYPDAPTVHHIRYASEDSMAHEASLPAWVEGLDDRPLVYATTGTVFDPDGRLLSILARGAASHDVEVLVVTGGKVDQADLGELPDNVHVERYVPQTLVIPRCRAVLCHGSSSNVFGALAEGVPLVLAPSHPTRPRPVGCVPRLAQVSRWPPRSYRARSSRSPGRRSRPNDRSPTRLATSSPPRGSPPRPATSQRPSGPIPRSPTGSR